MDAAGLAYVPYEAAYTRSSGVHVAFAALFLLAGTYLCTFGRRFWRLTCAISVALALELVATAAVFNVIGSDGLQSSYSDKSNDLAIFGIINGIALAGLLLSLLLSVRWYIGWWPGFATLGALAGLSFGATMMILGSGEGMLISNIVGRWVFLAVLALIGLAAVMFTKWRGATLACCLIGCWLLALGIDLIVNRNTGASRGLRKLLDENGLHSEALRAYDPPLSTRVLFGLSWALALIFFALQNFLYSDRVFLQLPPAMQQGSRWKMLFLPYLARNRKGRSSSTAGDVDLEKRDETPLTANGLDVQGIRSPSSEPASTPSTVQDDSEVAERTSLASGSDLRAMTANYRRALAILDGDEDADTTQTPATAATTAIPIYYRPSPVALVASPVRPSFDKEQRRLSPEQPTNAPSPTAELTAVRLVSPTRVGARREMPSATAQPVGPAVPIAYQSRRASVDQIPDLGAIGRAESDRGTTYSVPLSNFTHSEYRDRDDVRPPSWSGDLPWNPSMLRGDLDPATLPRHPQSVGHYQYQNTAHQQRRSNEPVNASSAIPVAGQNATGARGSRSPAPGLAAPAEEEYEIVEIDEAEPVASARPNLRISQPFQMAAAYPSRPGSRDGSPILGPLASLGGQGRSIQKLQRTPVRERHMFPADDDLPDHSLVSPEGALPAAGHDRLRTSETAVDAPRHFERDEEATETELLNDDGSVSERGPSTHASYSVTNFKRSRVPVPTKRRDHENSNAIRKSMNTVSSESGGTGMLADRPVTQSDMTPEIYDLPAPSRPHLVHNDSPPISNKASISLAGTPGGSSYNILAGAGQATGSRSELSEQTVRPSQEQRRSMEMDRLANQQAVSAEAGIQDTRDDQRRVRFFDSSTGSRRTLRERLLRR